MSGERRQLSQIREERDLVVPLTKINLTGDFAPIEVDTTSSVVEIRCRSLMIAWLRARISTQILISFGLDGLGTTANGELIQEEEFVNHSPAACNLRILLAFYQHPASFISL